MENVWVLLGISLGKFSFFWDLVSGFFLIFVVSLQRQGCEMSKKTSNKEFKIETIGAPKFSVLLKEEFNSLITCLEFQIREFYKEMNNQDFKQSKLDKNSQNE